MKLMTICYMLMILYLLGYYQRNQCPKGIQCNFLHVYKNPGGLYSDADRDFEDKRSGY